MQAWKILALIAVLAGLPAAMYLLHRLCLKLEERGLLYYKHKRPESSAAGCFVALQQALEPTSKHVLRVEDDQRRRSDDEAPGEGDAKTAAARRLDREGPQSASEFPLAVDRREHGDDLHDR